MLARAYEKGYRSALEKLGMRLPDPGGSAGLSLTNGVMPTPTRSVDKPMPPLPARGGQPLMPQRAMTNQQMPTSQMPKVPL